MNPSIEMKQKAEYARQDRSIAKALAVCFPEVLENLMVSNEKIRENVETLQHILHRLCAEESPAPPPPPAMSGVVLQDFQDVAGYTRELQAFLDKVSNNLLNLIRVQAP